MHRVINFWADVFLWKNACSLKLNSAGDMHFDFFFLAFAFCCGLCYYITNFSWYKIKGGIIIKKGENKNEIFCFTGFLMLFCGKFQFFSPLWNEAIFATSAVHMRGILKLASTVCWSALLVHLFPAGCTDSFCRGQWCELSGSTGKVV